MDGERPGGFPFPLIEGPEESRYLTWVRNHSNYMAERGFLDYMRIVAVLVRGILVNFLTLLPYLLVGALLVGVLYNPMLDSWQAAGQDATAEPMSQPALRSAQAKPMWLAPTGSFPTRDLGARPAPARRTTDPVGADLARYRRLGLGPEFSETASPKDHGALSADAAARL